MSEFKIVALIIYIMCLIICLGAFIYDYDVKFIAVAGWLVAILLLGMVK